MKLVECVPNFSEGRDQKKVSEIVAAAKGVSGVRILDVETDADHNRCVLSFVAPPDAAVEACFEVAKASSRLIDLNSHRGEHPRMGAVDVIPFIPVRGISIEECAILAEKLGEKIGRELQIPVYLYDQAAKRPDRKDLANVRKGQFEGLKDLIGKDSARDPDFGPKKIHPTAGAVAVGARRQIVNFNLNLDSADMAAGKEIAKSIRASSGGLPGVRAKEIELAKRHQVQISTVLTDYKTTGVKRVFDEVSRRAKVASTEIVGLVPAESLVDFASETLKLENFKPEIQVLERRLEESGVGWAEAGAVFCEALATTDSTPGGGAAAAVSGAAGAALALMAIGISLKSKKLDAAKRPFLEDAFTKIVCLKSELLALAEADAKAFDLFMEAAGLPKDDASRPERMQKALRHAAEVPLLTAEKSAEAFALALQAKESVSPAVVSDANCALHLLKAAALCAAENVRINLSGLKDKPESARLEARLKNSLNRLRSDP